MSVRPGAGPPDGRDTKILFFAGAVAHWWFDNWDTPEHWEYMQWRRDAETACVAHGDLVYKHYDALKGPWVDRAQKINEFALSQSDALVILTDEKIPSEGTDDEIKFCEEHGIPYVRVPSSLGVRQLILILEELFSASGTPAQ